MFVTLRNVVVRFSFKDNSKSKISKKYISCLKKIFLDRFPSHHFLLLHLLPSDSPPPSQSLRTSLSRYLSSSSSSLPLSSHRTPYAHRIRNLNLVTAYTHSDTLTEPQNDGKSELDPSSDEAASNDLNSPKHSRGDADKEEEESVSLPKENNGMRSVTTPTATTSTSKNGTVKKSKKENKSVLATKSTRIEDGNL
ncbi:unnamed protein product [Vicia faba]|uniref:Uncharacterized protein n=1 Tax=Vicia faba TaxID=3906 RepID=A0AAV0Z9Y2_VICFA|nr:unnamed protein product [Vicia faba]